MIGLGRLGRGSLLQNQRIPDLVNGGYHPHLVDVYIPAGTVFNVVVGLHGGGATKEQFAQQVGVLMGGTTVSADNTNWTLLEFWHTAFVAIQGQEIAGSTYPTWSSNFMTSGVDDVAMLKDAKPWLASLIPGAGINAIGHSAGAFMLARMMYESPNTFAHVSQWCAGSASTYLNTAAPAVVVPCLRIFGALDTTIGVQDYYTGALDFYQDLWWQDPTHINREDVAYPNRSSTEGGWHQFVKFVAAAGGAAQQADGSTSAAATGTVTQWSYIAGKQQCRLYSASDHGMDQLKTAIGLRPLFVHCQWQNSI